MHLVNSVDLITLDENKRILLVKRNEPDELDNDEWSIPGGGAKAGESIEEALVREIKEELNCKITKFTYFRSYFEKESDKDVRGFYFYSKIKGSIKLSVEHSKYKWFSFEKIVALKKSELAFNQKEVLMDFIDFYEKQSEIRSF